MGSGFARKKKEAKLMQQQFQQLQTQMAQAEATGTAGGGLVTLTLNGEGALIRLKINPQCVDSEDIEGLEALIKAAHADAQQRLQASSSQALPFSIPH